MVIFRVANIPHTTQIETAFPQTMADNHTQKIGADTNQKENYKMGLYLDQMGHLLQIIDWPYHHLAVPVAERGSGKEDCQRQVGSAIGHEQEMAGLPLDS